MAMKRKLDLDVEHDDLGPLKQKQLKLVPFPNYQHEDSEMMDVEPLRPEQHHLRLPSDASAYSSASTSPLTTSLPLYHSYDAQPSPFFNPETGAVDHNSHSYAHYSAQSSPSQSAVGLMQPSANGFVHHGSNCTQIPKLRVACASGLDGRRTMWSHCEQCGAIQMVDCD